MYNYQILKNHIIHYFNAKKKEWSNFKCDSNFKNYLFDCIKKWEYLFHNVFLKDKRFLYIAEPFNSDTLVDPCQYYMRMDGSIVFTEAVFLDDKGELIGGHPLRFPFEKNVKDSYLSHNIEKDIFGIPMKCTTKVFWNGRKDYGKQTEECIRIVNNQKNTRYPILPLYFHNQKVNNENFRIIQTPVFRRDNFIVYFPFKKAFNYMYNVVKFEPVVKGADWLMNKAHSFEWSNIPKIEFGNLGVTGSTSFGDTNDREDFDVVIINKLENLRKFRDFLINGVNRGLFTAVSKNRKLRVFLNDIKIECNNNQPLILCTFQNLDNIKTDFLYRCRFNILGKIDYFEAAVSDDSENMLTPPRIKISDIKNLKSKLNIKIENNSLFIQMAGTSRGLYNKGSRIKSRNNLYVEFKPEFGNWFKAIVSLGWYDTDIF